MLEALSESPDLTRGVLRDDVLSSLLSTIRLSGSLQFCFMSSGAWQTDDKPSIGSLSARASETIPFHIVASGCCWLRMHGETSVLEAGDVVMFPLGTGHQLGAGEDGLLLDPVAQLPPKPWHQIPVLHLTGRPPRVSLLCGYLRCDGISFAPLRRTLPKLIHVKAASAGDAEWLRVTIRQMLDEVETPRAGGISMLARLTEIIFITILRHEIMKAPPQATGWLAALADPALSRCLSLIHDDPVHDWSLEALSHASRLSRSALAERFQTILDTSPMRYVREWRLYLSRVALATTSRPISTIAYEAGYATEAAFNRAFSRAFGSPPGVFRSEAQRE